MTNLDISQTVMYLTFKTIYNMQNKTKNQKKSEGCFSICFTEAADKDA